MPQSAQSPTYDQILDAVATVVRFGSGLDSSKIVEWFADQRPEVEGRQFVSIWLKEWIPHEYPGADREGYLCDLILQVTLWTRMMLDKAATGRWRLRNSAQGHLPRLQGIMDFLVGENLFDAYNEQTQLPTSTANALCWQPLQHLPGRFIERVSQEDETWIKSEVKFRMLIAEPLTVEEEV